MAEPEDESPSAAEAAAEAAADVTEAESPLQRRAMAAAFARAAATGVAFGRAATAGARAAGRGTRVARQGMNDGINWLVAQVTAMAPRLRVRDQAALRAQFPDKAADEIAGALIDAAARASAAAGGAAGVWAALPTLPAYPAEVAAETLVVVGIEIKLIAELHEAYGLPAPGGFPERMTAYVAAWAHRRGVFAVPGGVVVAAGSPLARLLRRRLAARAGRSAFSLGPLLTGAAAGAMLNGRETRRLGQIVRRDLRGALTGP
jgi:hypothetical protein